VEATTATAVYLDIFDDGAASLRVIPAVAASDGVGPATTATNPRTASAAARIGFSFD
jgi:hypothetical protein